MQNVAAMEEFPTTTDGERNTLGIKIKSQNRTSGAPIHWGASRKYTIDSISLAI